MKTKKKTFSTSEYEVIHTTPLVGHSGCEIVLLQTSSGAIVRKTSKSLAYNERLKKQCQKQKCFTQKKKIRAPEVLNQGEDDQGLFFFEMNYIAGQSFANYIEDHSNLNTKTVVSDVLSLLEMNKSVVDPQFSKKFQNKIEDLYSELPNTRLVRTSLNILKNYEWKPELSSPCHGDLTFENILVSRSGEIFLIDFLDSFCDSWIMDVAKLLQDLELEWSFRNGQPNIFMKIRLSVIKNYFLQEILRRPDGAEVIKTSYYALLLNILRIIPYSSPNKKSYYDDLLRRSLNAIKQFEKHHKGVG